VLIWVGYIVSVGTVIYLLMILHVIEATLRHAYDYLFGVLLLG